MKLRLYGLPALLLACTASLCAAETAEPLDASVYARAEKLLAPNLEDKVRNTLSIPHWMGERDCFWYRRETATGHEFVSVEAESGRSSLLFDHAAMARSMATLLGEEFDGGRLPFDDFEWVEERAIMRFARQDKFIECGIDAAQCRLAGDTDPTDAAISPDRRLAVFTHANNLWLRDMQSGTERPLTEDGIEDFGYGIHYGNWQAKFVERSQGGDKLPPMIVYWSPDSSRLIATRLDQRHVAPYPFVDHTPESGFRPRLYQARMPFAGEETPRLEYWVFDIASGARRQLDVPEDLLWLHQDLHAWRKVWWNSDASHLYAVAHGAHLKSGYLLDFDLKTGSYRTVIREELLPRTDLNSSSYNPPAVDVIGDLDEVIWWSQRDGWGHLYRYDGQSGDLINQVTSGDWLVRDLLRVDRQAGRLYFSASGREDGNPYYRYLYRIDLDGENLQLLSPEPADHLLTGLGDFVLTLDGAAPYQVVSPSGEYAVYNFSTVDQPGRAVIRRTGDAGLVAEFERADASALLDQGWRPPEEFVVKAADGRTDLWGVLYKPSDFDASKRYPIIDAQYASPLTAVTPRNFFMAYRQRSPQSPSAVAELGFVVMTIDARGTTYRSREFSQEGFGKLDEIGLYDHVAAIRQLAEEHAFIDLDRVGIYGHSYGGYAATRAMLEYPEFFKVAVAGAGPAVMQGLYVDYHWTAYHGAPVYADGSERMGQPGEVADNWADLNGAQQADRLQGKLLIMFGELDENVPPSSILQFIEGLIRADKDFDMLYLPHRNHQFAGEPYVVRRQWDYLVRHLAGREPPAYTITTSGR